MNEVTHPNRYVLTPSVVVFVNTVVQLDRDCHIAIVSTSGTCVPERLPYNLGLGIELG